MDPFQEVVAANHRLANMNEVLGKRVGTWKTRALVATGLLIGYVASTFLFVEEREEVQPVPVAEEIPVPVEVTVYEPCDYCGGTTAPLTETVCDGGCKSYHEIWTSCRSSWRLVELAVSVLLQDSAGFR